MFRPTGSFLLAWRQHGPPKLWYPTTSLHGVIPVSYWHAQGSSHFYTHCYIPMSASRTHSLYPEDRGSKFL